MNPLAPMFAAVWSAFTDGTILGLAELEELIERCGFAEWGEATEADVAASDLELEVGDPMLVLTAEGRRLLHEGNLGGASEP